MAMVFKLLASYNFKFSFKFTQKVVSIFLNRLLILIVLLNVENGSRIVCSCLLGCLLYSYWDVLSY